MSKPSLKVPIGLGQGGAVAASGQSPFMAESYVAKKRMYYENSAKFTYLNSPRSYRPKVMSLFYMCLIVPICGYLYNTDKNGSRKS